MCPRSTRFNRWLTQYNEKFGRSNKQYLKNLPLVLDPQRALETTKNIEKISAAYITQGNAVTALVRATANYDKQINAFNQKIAKIPYQDVIMSLQVMATHQMTLINAAEEGSAEQARLNNEFEQTILRLEAFRIYTEQLQ